MTCLVCPIPSTYVEARSPVLGPAVLRCGDDVADTPRHPDDVACAMSPSNEVRRVVLPLGTRLAPEFCLLVVFDSRMIAALFGFNYGI